MNWPSIKSIGKPNWVNESGNVHSEDAARGRISVRRMPSQNATQKLHL